MSKSLAILSTFLLLILTTHQASATAPSALDHMTETEAHKLAAREAIALSIREVRETKKFVVDSLLGLKTVSLTLQTNHLLPCVEALVLDLTGMKYTLQRLKHLKLMTLNSDTESLRKTMAHVVRLGNKCSHSLKNVDRIVPSMLTRKLDDLSVVVYDVVYQVSMIERDVYGAGIGGKA